MAAMSHEHGMQIAVQMMVRNAAQSCGVKVRCLKMRHISLCTPRECDYNGALSPALSSLII